MTSAATVTDWVGYVAATLTTLSFVPQARHTFQTRDVSGISLGMYSAFTLGVLLWLVYGVLLGAWPVIIANVITLALAACILVMKLLHGRAAHQKRYDRPKVGHRPEVDLGGQHRGAGRDQLRLGIHPRHAGEQAPGLVERVVQAGLHDQAGRIRHLHVGRELDFTLVNLV